MRTGAMENRIKEQQLGLFSDRTLAHRLRTNQLRRCFGSFAHGLLEVIWYWGLRGSQLARAQCGTIRVKLLKIDVQPRVSSVALARATR